MVLQALPARVTAAHPQGRGGARAGCLSWVSQPPHLQPVAEVDEEKGLGVLAAEQVKARGGHLVGPPPTREAALQGQPIQAVRGLHALLPWPYLQGFHQLRDLVPAFLLRAFVGIGLAGIHAAAMDAADAPGLPGLAHKLAQHRALPARILLEGDVGGEGRVLQHTPAVGAAPGGGGGFKADCCRYDETAMRTRDTLKRLLNDPCAAFDSRESIAGLCVGLYICRAGTAPHHGVAPG